MADAQDAVNADGAADPAAATATAAGAAATTGAQDGVSAGASTGTEDAASKKVLMQGSLYTAGAFAPILVTILVTPLVTRLLGAEEYGVIGLTTTLVQIGLVVLSFGMAEPITRHGVMEGTGIPGARWLALATIVPSAVVAGIAAATTPLWVPALLHTEWRPAWLLAILAAFLFSVITNIHAVLRAMDRPGYYVLLSLIASLGGPFLGLLGVFFLSKTADAYIWGLVVGYLCSIATGLPVLLRGDPLQHAKGDFGKSVRMGLPMVFNQIAVYLTTFTLVTLATRMGGVGDGGRIQLAMFVGTAPSVIAVAFSNSWAPMIYRTRPEDRGRVTTHVATDIAGVVTILGGGIAMLAPWVLQLLVPASYDPLMLAKVASQATVGGVLTVGYLASVYVLMVKGRTLGLAFVVPGAVLALAAAAGLAGSAFHIDVIGWGFPFAYLFMALGAYALRSLLGAVRWQPAALVPALAASAVLAVAGVYLPVTGIGMVVRLVVAAALAVLGLRLVKRVAG